MTLKHFFTPGLSINSYLLFDEKTKQAVVVDPTRDIEAYLQFARENKLEITDIVETHVHADFVSGAKELKARLGGKPTIHCSGMGGAEWTPHYADHVVKDGDAFSIGSLRFQAWHTPGHTPEHLIWVVFDNAHSQEVPWLAFTGDLIFVGSLGRPDLLGEKTVTKLSKEMYHTIFDVVAKLPDSLEIYPAHGAGSLCGKGISSSQLSSTLGNERQYNPGFLIKEEKQWTEAMQKDLPAAPQYFKVLKKVNLEGPSSASTELPKVFTHIEEMKDHFLIDVRNPENFAASHVPGAINIPFGSSFSSWAGAVIPYNTPLVIVLDRESDLKQIVDSLKLIGYDMIKGYANINSIDKSQMQSLSMISAELLKEKKQEMQEALYILDVRTPSEWEMGHIDTAHHIELNNLPNAIPEISKDTNIAVLCGAGNRASVAASLLAKKGFKNVSNIRGGMQAWNKLNPSQISRT